MAILAVWLPCSVALAEPVRESLVYKHYPVALAEGESLGEALRRATPIRPRWWKRFHGLTAWNVSWSYRPQPETDGSCTAVDVVVELASEITLPELIGGSPGEQTAFGTYLAALKVHEMGHHAIARGVAEKIHAGILDAGRLPDCGAVEAQIQALTDRLMTDAKAEEQRYDRETGFGRTQGVRLEPWSE